MTIANGNRLDLRFVQGISSLSCYLDPLAISVCPDGAVNGNVESPCVGSISVSDLTPNL